MFTSCKIWGEKKLKRKNRKKKFLMFVYHEKCEKINHIKLIKNLYRLFILIENKK